ncbi:hypothetical protein PoB_007505000 [Plakobranchus ocellatus]|uniref:F5/8 type C domain-containing protein n=1 Tax=Plakobranchus ocellatus TaxID=259542 RepID=A0AAV4DWZ7_9GAST|nr:hypothetical protein PoB_007505000 [Plakobranchus ocellatus]
MTSRRKTVGILRLELKATGRFSSVALYCFPHLYRLFSKSKRSSLKINLFDVGYKEMWTVNQMEWVSDMRKSPTFQSSDDGKAF